MFLRLAADVMEQGMSQHAGSCLCQSVAFAASGEVSGFFLCHCTRCQKGSGSAHAANIFLTSGTLSWTKGEKKVTTYNMPGNRHAKSFCQICGSALPTTAPSGTIVVPAGCLDSSVEARPQAHIFCASQATWEHELEQVPRFDEFPQS